MNKRKIAIIVVACLIAVAVIVGGIIYFVSEKKYSESGYGEVFGVDVTNEKEINVRCSAPYLSKSTKYIVENESGVKCTFLKDGKEKSIDGTIASISYSRTKADFYKLGEITLTLKLDEELTEGNNYHVVISKDSFSTKKDDYKNKEITADFSFDKDENGKYNSNEETYYNAKTEKLENMSASFKTIDNKHYAVINAEVENATVFNEDAVKNMKAFAFISYVNGGYHGSFALQNMSVEVKGKMLTIEAEVDDKDVIEGQEYTVNLSEGFMVNKDKSVVSQESQCVFTYVK